MPLTVTLPHTLHFPLCSECFKNSYTSQEHLIHQMYTNILQIVFYLLAGASAV